MARTLFDKELNIIRTDLAQLSDNVSVATSRAVSSLINRDFDEARGVKLEDKVNDELRYRVEDECLTAIATQQPVAHDLRELVAATFVAVELERCGDYAKGVAKAARKISRLDSDSGLGPYNLSEMDRVARDMLEQSAKAFIAKDVESAKAIIEADNYVDKLYNDLVVFTTAMMSNDPSHIENGVWLMHAGHCLERIADRATNIAERVIFVETGVAADMNTHTPEEARRIGV
jgi:phosphate transport system protein